MALVFQYGSNMCSDRLNSSDRLVGDARVICIARTISLFEYAFTVFSKTNNCAAADIVSSEAGQRIFGVLYEIPDFLLSRESAKILGRRSMDAIEGEGTNYIRQTIEVEKMDGSTVKALTYVVKDRKADIKTSMKYVKYILDGMKEHNIPEAYCRYVASQAIANNHDLAQELQIAVGIKDRSAS